MAKNPGIAKITNQQQFVDNRIVIFQQSCQKLFTELMAYMRRTAKLRNNGDLIVEILRSIADTQLFNSSISKTLNSFSEILQEIEDLRNAELERLKIHVAQDLSTFGLEINKYRLSAKQMFNIKKKDATSQNMNPTSNSNAGAVSYDQNDSLNIFIKEFEEKKISILQKSLKNFVHTEMLMHIKALELYSLAYPKLDEIQTASDCTQLLETLHRNENLPTKISLKNTQSMSATTKSTPNMNLTNNQTTKSFPPGTSNEQTPTRKIGRVRIEKNQREIESDYDDDDSQSLSMDETEEYREMLQKNVNHKTSSSQKPRFSKTTKGPPLAKPRKQRTSFISDDNESNTRYNEDLDDASYDDYQNDSFEENEQKIRPEFGAKNVKKSSKTRKST